MPVMKTSGSGLPKMAEAPMMEKKSCCGMPNMGHHCCGHNVGRRLVFTLVGILLAYVIVLVGTMIRNNMQEFYYIGKMDKNERLVTLDAQGKVTVKPDLGVTTIGMTSDAKTVAEAQKNNTEVMNKLLARLKQLGIQEKDIQTANYNVYPQYDYTNNGSVLKGYQVSQNVTIKIRDLTKADQVLGLAGEVGANSVSGLQFTFDDNEVYKAEARTEALKKITEKAKILAKQLNVNFVNVVSYNEYSGDNAVYPMAYAKDAMGMGGAAPSPEIQVGTNDVIMNVNVTFEIR
jgi:hypothetical protein